MLRLVLAIVLLSPPVGVLAATFVAPNENAALFPRDQIPLDTDTMRELSGHLTELARREHKNDPAQLRATAQILAIAARLDPTNRAAREIAKALANEQPVDPPEGDLNHPLRQAWGIADWLVSPEAGEAGNLLGNQTIDALAVINPRSPLAKLHKPKNEAERWGKVVPQLAAYQRGASNHAHPAPKAVPAPIIRPPILLHQAAVQTPLFLYDAELRRHLRIARVTMKIVPEEELESLNFSLNPNVDSPFVEASQFHLRSLLQKRWPHLPIEKTAQLSLNQESYASKNEQAISGAAALLLHAALTGKELRPDVVIVGTLTAEGALTRPRQSWNYLRALRVAEGGRLLVPSSFQSELNAILALEDPGFFLRWEVLLVDSVATALELASAQGDPEALAGTAATFQNLRNIGRRDDVGQLCVNARVREHLSEILTAVPFHYSAKMLLTQGDALERPTRVERPVAARILRSAIDPLVGIANNPLEEANARRLLSAGEASRAEIERFTKIIAPSDSDLIREANELAQLVETIGRGMRDGEMRDGTMFYRQVPLPTYFQGLQKRLSAFLKKIVPFTQETFPDPFESAPGP